MPHDESRSRSEISRLLIELRAELGETQQSFAQRVGAAVTSVARWETTYPPRGKTLERLAQIAAENGRDDLAKRFKTVFRRIAPLDVIHILNLSITQLENLPNLKGPQFEHSHADLLHGLQQARDLSIALDQKYGRKIEPKGANKKRK